MSSTKCKSLILLLLASLLFVALGLGFDYYRYDTGRKHRGISRTRLTMLRQALMLHAHKHSGMLPDSLDELSPKYIDPKEMYPVQKDVPNYGLQYEKAGTRAGSSQGHDVLIAESSNAYSRTRTLFGTLKGGHHIITKNGAVVFVTRDHSASIETR